MLPNFKLLRTSELTFFGPLFPRINFLCSNSWLKCKWCHTLKNTTRVEIIITVIVEDYMNIKAKFFVILRIAVPIVIVILTCVVFWEYDVIYSNSQPRLGTRKINGGRKLSEIKFQKHVCLARSSRKTYCVWKCKKMAIENLILEAL